MKVRLLFLPTTIICLGMLVQPQSARAAFSDSTIPASVPDTTPAAPTAAVPAAQGNGARTENSAGPQFSFTVAGATDYIFRGVSQTEDNPAIFGKGLVSYDGFYVGVGAENVNFHNRTEAEYDLSGGWKPSVAGFDFDLGVLRYGYINQLGPSIDTIDLKGAVSHDFGPATLGTAIFYEPDYFGTKGDGSYFEGNAAYKITGDLSASGALGRQLIENGTDFTTWNIGGTYAIAKNIGVDLRYYDTDEHVLGNLYGSHFVVAFKASL